MSYFKRIALIIIEKFIKFLKINQRIDEIKVNQGLILAKLNQSISSKNIRDYEFKIFSQCDNKQEF